MISACVKSFLICSLCLQFNVQESFADFDITTHRNWHLLPENCGQSLSTDRIIGGTNASMGQYPWLAQIGYLLEDCSIVTKPMFRCGGSVINDRYILTAAHCVTNLPKAKCPFKGELPFQLAVVRLGEHFAHLDIDCVDGICAAPVQDVKPEQVLIHAKYNTPKFKHDIALIRTNRKINFNGWVAPICLPRSSQLSKSYIGSKVEVAGWGITDIKKEEMSNFLMYVKLPIIAIHHCIRVYRKITPVGPHQLCAGGVEGKDSCGGDSGGPAMIIDDIEGPPRYYLYGLVSFGPSRCGVPKPAVYTRVSAYIYWILHNIKP